MERIHYLKMETSAESSSIHTRVWSSLILSKFSKYPPNVLFISNEPIILVIDIPFIVLEMIPHAPTAVSNTPLFRPTILKVERDLMSEPNVKHNVKQKFRLKEDVVPSVFTFCEAKEKCRSIILTNTKSRNEILQPIRRDESDQTNDESLLTPMGKQIEPDNEKVPELSSDDEISLDEHDVSFQETKNISYKMIWGCLFRGCS